MILSPETIQWLLGSSTPAIRFQTLTDLLGRDANDPEAAAAHAAIMTTGPVPGILEKQNPSGGWVSDSHYYSPKFRSSHWSMMLLAELGVDGGDARFRLGAEHMLTVVQKDLERRWQKGDTSWTCFYGNLLRYVFLAGKQDDDRVTLVMRFCLRALEDGACRCDYNYGEGCSWGVIRLLWGLAQLPPEARTVEVSQAIQRGVAFMTDRYDLASANYPTGEGKIHELWSKLSFPLFYHADLLFVLRVLDELGELARPGAQTALDTLAEKRGKNGRWRGGSPFRQRTWAAVGNAEETERWVTLQAARVLLHAGRLKLE